VRILNIRSIVKATFQEESSLPSRVEDLQFVTRHHTSVYRVRAGGSTFIVHVTPHGTEDLSRIRNNLRALESFVDGDQIPRVLAWRDSGPEALLDQRWAVLVMSDIPGLEMSARTFTPPAWLSLCDLLRRIHSMPAQQGSELSISHRIDRAATFHDFADTFVLQLSGFPLRQERVRAHLRAMTDYVEKHAGAFSVLPRLIHGDINRENIRIHDGRAGIIDWSDMGAGDYAYDLAMLKFSLDSVAPRVSASRIRELALDYRRDFQDDSLELRLRFFLALPGLVSAFWYTNESALFPAARAWRVRTCYLHSEAQWQAPVSLDEAHVLAPTIRTEHWALRIPQPVRGLFYLVAPKRVA
jgi:aminoglycoside phosphotransferase (APT) family kinase protein